MPRFRIEADVFQRCDHFILARGGGKPRLVHPQAFAYDFRDRHARRQRAVGVLKYDLHVAPEWAKCPEFQPLNGLAKEYDGTVARDQA